MIYYYISGEHFMAWENAQDITLSQEKNQESNYKHRLPNL